MMGDPEAEARAGEVGGGGGNGGGPIRMTITGSQAGIMMTFGAGVWFCAVLLGASLLSPGVPMFWRVSVILGVLFLVWWGFGFFASAITSLKSPVFTLYDDRLVCHDYRGDLVVPLAAIERRTYEKRRGIVSLVVEYDGHRIAIPETLRHSAEVFARLQGDAESPPAR